MLESLKKFFGESKEVTETAPPVKMRITKKRLCEILDLPFDGEDKEYTGLNYPGVVKPGNVAIIQRPRVSPLRGTPKNARHTLAEKAMERGADVIITTVKMKGYPCMVVPSPIIDSVVKIIHEHWKEIKPLTMEVTGSYGKTTVVSMLESVLGTKHKVFGHNGDSLNMVVHTVMRTQAWDSSYDIFLQEAAEGAHPGVPELISKMLEPDVCLVTNVGTSHIERMGSQEVIFESCIGLQEGMNENGVLILNGDDPFLIKAETKRKTVYYGMYNENVNYRAVNVRSTVDGITFDILHDGVRTPVTMNCVGTHNAQNAAGVFAAAKAAGMSDSDIAKGLSYFTPSGYRQRLFHASKYHFYLDCYNASVESMKSALDGMSEIEISKGGRRIAVLSDIAQAGEFTEQFHREVGRFAAESKLDILICNGENAELVAEEAKKNPNLKIYIMKTLEEIEDFLEKNVKASDLILLKGSHSTNLYLIPDDLLGTWFKEDIKNTYAYIREGLKYRLYPNSASGFFMGALEDASEISITSSINDIEITGIGEEAFANSMVCEVKLPDTLQNIRRRAFYQAKMLRRVDLPDNVMFIDDEAFYKCSKLREIRLSSNIRHIADNAFDKTRRLTFICPKGSYADEYARRKGIKVRYE